jgi:hypothetical protein
MTLAALQNYKSELFNPEKKTQVGLELGFVALVTLVSYVATRMTNNHKISAPECLVAGLSSLVFNHVIDAAALTIFKSYYTKKGVLQAASVGAITSLSTLGSLHVFSKIAPVKVTEESIEILQRIYLIAFPITFTQSK